MKISLLPLLIIGLLACDAVIMDVEMEESNTTPPLNYLAIGDSYTIGEGVSASENFPYQLFNNSSNIEHISGDFKIIAKTGWTTENLLNAIAEEEIKEGEYNFITLLIGVNNQYQGKEFSKYEMEFNMLMDKAIEILKGKAKNLVVVSIPDYSVTPFASSKDVERIASEIKSYNDYAQAIAEQRGAQYVYITDLTQNAKDDSSLLANDKLHPSGKSYGQWVERIAPELNLIIKGLK